MSLARLAEIKARYARTGTDKPPWQEVCIDVGELVAEVERLTGPPPDRRRSTTGLRWTARSLAPSGSVWAVSSRGASKLFTAAAWATMAPDPSSPPPAPPGRAEPPSDGG